MKQFKRMIAALLLLCAAAGIGAGCAPKTAEDQNTLTVTLSAFKGMTYADVLRKKFPDINFVVEEYAGANMSEYMLQQLQRGEASDLVFYTTVLNTPWIKDCLIDLSGKSFLSNYDRGVLKTVNIDNSIYQIPGPVICRYFVVNKTLFEENGWKIPENFDDVVAVCKQIRQEKPDIVPIGLGLAGAGYPFTVISSHAQCGFLSTLAGKEAEKNYLAGNASVATIFGDGLDMAAELVDAGAFDAEMFSRIWEVPAKALGDRKIAMGYIMNTYEENEILFSGTAPQGKEDVYGAYRDEFAFLPFFGREDDQKGLILGASSMWGVNKRLEQKGNEKKLENAMRIMEWLATEEGQLAIRQNSSAIPALRGLQTDDVSAYIRTLWSESENLPKEFFLYTGYEDIMIEATKAFTNAMASGSSVGMKEKFVKTADKLHRETVKHQKSSISFGKIERTLSVEESRKLGCDAVRTTAGADIAIVSECGRGVGNNNQTGFAGYFFSGDLTEAFIIITIGSPRQNLETASMTGKEIKELLARGKVMKNAEGVEDVFPYWASGVEITRENGAVTKVTRNGEALDDHAVFTVAMLLNDTPHDFPHERFTDCGVTVGEAIGEYVRSGGAE